MSCGRLPSHEASPHIQTDGSCRANQNPRAPAYCSKAWCSCRSRVSQHAYCKRPAGRPRSDGSIGIVQRDSLNDIPWPAAPRIRPLQCKPVERRATDGASGARRQAQVPSVTSTCIYLGRRDSGTASGGRDSTRRFFHRVPLRRGQQVSARSRGTSDNSQDQGRIQRAAITIDWVDRLLAAGGHHRLNVGSCVPFDRGSVTACCYRQWHRSTPRLAEEHAAHHPAEQSTHIIHHHHGGAPSPSFNTPRAAQRASHDHSSMARARHLFARRVRMPSCGAQRTQLSIDSRLRWASRRSASHGHSCDAGVHDCAGPHFATLHDGAGQAVGGQY
ncbi:hypothetical protein PMIN01_11357 [Paraphaeosphaeria minitans]|uniref:Uncharacterized protein n=1 Tax=Paraphaeosphaeria minitans TaxID=565426 RepID=A0A9P6G842_9PLEO|nr:hypothetical protein PMIN01_11357 [Paraphaeosphaeria minitans]